jgi:iron complex outermembrane recepter protein
VRILFNFLNILIISTSISSAQGTINISGTIRNQENEVLPGATIFVHELNRGTVSDSEGKYLIANIRKGTYHIHITYVGYESTSATIIIDKETKKDFVLKSTLFELKELFVEAYPFKSGPVEQSMTIESVDRSFLEKNSGATLINSLEKIPGISSINTGVGISKPVIRGMAFNRVMVNDHGVKQEGQQWGADHGLEVDQYGVERVEILKGPGALIYGPDGIGGIINIKAPALPKNNTISGSITSFVKTNNDLFGSSGMVEGNKEGKVFRARFTAQDFGDYRVPADRFSYASFILPIHEQRLKNTAGFERNLSLMGGLKKEWGYSTVTVSNYFQKAGLFPGALGRPRAYQLNHNGDHRNIELPNMETNHFKVISNTNVLFNQNWLEIDLGYQKNLRRELSAPHAHGSAPTPEGNLAMELNLQTLTGNIRFHKNYSHKLKGIHGTQLQYQDNNIGGFEFFLPEYNSFSTGIFNYFELKQSEKLYLNSGIRFDYGRHIINKYLQPIYSLSEGFTGFVERSSNIDKDFYNASGALGASWLPLHNFNIKINAGSSFRMPTPVELGASGVHHGNFRYELGDKDLKSERGYQFDLNATYYSKFIHISATPFWSFFDNYIYLRPSNRFASSLNLPFYTGGHLWEYTQARGIFTGIEFKTDLHFTKNIHLNTAAEYVYNYNLNTSLAFPLTPPLSALAELEYTIPINSQILSSLFFNIGSQIFAAQNRVDRNERITPGYHLFYADAGLDLSIFRQPVTIYFSGRNLTNENFFNHLSRYRLLNLPEQGRNYLFTLKVPFSLNL